MTAMVDDPIAVAAVAAVAAVLCMIDFAEASAGVGHD